MPEGGRIAVETSVREIVAEDRAHFDEMGPGTYGVLAITDTGVGIAPRSSSA